MAQERAEHQPSNEQFFEAHDVIGLLTAFKDPDLIEAQVEIMPPKAKDLLLEYLVVVDPELNARPYEPIAAALWRDLAMREKILAHQGTWPKVRRELFQRRMTCRYNGDVAVSRPEPQTATDLLAQAIPPPAPIVENVIHEGMLLLGGKSKRGGCRRTSGVAERGATVGSAAWCVPKGARRRLQGARRCLMAVSCWALTASWPGSTTTASRLVPHPLGRVTADSRIRVGYGRSAQSGQGFWA